MPRVRDLLYRFRPSAAPGSATVAGVPVDRARDLAAELEPVFAELADTERECAEIVEEARRGATRIRAEGAARAEAVKAAGRARIASERAAVAAATRKAGAAELTAASQAVEQSLADLRERADRLMPSYVDDVVASVRALVGAPTTVEAAPLEPAERQDDAGGPS